MKLEKTSIRFNIYNVFADLFVVTFSWYLAFVLRFQIEIIELTKGEDSFKRYVVLLPVILVSYLVAFSILDVYQGTLKRRRIWEENFYLAKSHIFAFLVFVASAYFLFDHRYSRVVLFLYFITTPFLFPFGRSAVRKIVRYQNRRQINRKLTAIIIGEGPVSERIREIIQERKDWNISLISAFSPSERNLSLAMISQNEIDIAFVTTHKNNAHWVEDVFANIGNTVAEIVYLPDFGAPTFLAPKPIQIAELPGVVLNASALQGFGPVFKRAFDFIFATTFIVVFSPVFLVCALLVKLSSPGPILFRQERMGLDGKTFMCLKFRGMVHNAEERSGPIWAKKDDDRTTGVGKWLRKTSLDEIPQFFNVLKGEMSVVGPRPERPVFVSEFRQKIPGYMLRHSVKAGITGWAQINGWRGNTSLERRIECDLWYLQNWSLLLDLKICILTPLKGFVHPNAY